MMQSEFYERTKVSLSGDEYAKVEHLYNNVKMDKDEFCKQWLKLRSNKLFEEMTDGIYRHHNELVEKVNSLYANCTSLKADYDALKKQYETDIERVAQDGMDAMLDMAKKLILANSPKEIYDVIEEEFGIAFIIKVKHEAGISLNNAEIEYMVSKL